MEIWLKVAGVASSGLFALFLGLIVAKPRVCLRIAQMIGGMAVSLSGTAVMGALGAFMSKRAVLKQAAETYAITDGEAQGDAFIQTSLAAAIDPVLGQFVGLAALSLVVVALCVGAIHVSRMVLEDEDSGGTGKRAARKSVQPD